VLSYVSRRSTQNEAHKTKVALINPSIVAIGKTIPQKNNTFCLDIILDIKKYSFLGMHLAPLKIGLSMHKK
jgi:hypothetical protein